MESREGEFEATRHNLNWFPELTVAIAIVLLVLSVLYAITFSRMLYISLMEQVIAVDLHPPRYAPHVHYHNGVEWVLIVGPALLGWVGIVGCLTFLVRRWRNR